VARTPAPAGEDPVTGTGRGADGAAPARAQRPARAGAAAARLATLAALDPAARAGPGLCRDLVVAAGRHGAGRRTRGLAGESAGAAAVDVGGQRHRHPSRLPAAGRTRGAEPG